MDTNLALALQLLDEDRRKEIARGVFRLARRLEPALESIPEATAEGSIASFARGLELYLRTGDVAALVDIVRATVVLRRLGGFGTPILLAMSHAYLPIIRKVFLRHAPDIARGLAAYDVVESAVLPLIVRLLQEAGRHEDDPFSSVAKTEERPEQPAFEIVSVDDELDRI
ncbi:MAG: hypothetical protein Q8O67_28935 [Deltaproteobacteria bacterium]|nr:hypothetical protein [Deltaproteobacteria bacterium]